MGPRLFGIAAREASIVAVIRRGPSHWCRVYRWDPPAGELEPGAWLHGTIYPQHSDLSPDGRWLCVFILKGNATWDLGPTYISISRPPSLTAVAAWATDGTWTRGFHFVDRAAGLDVGEPDHGDLDEIGRRFGLAPTRAATFAVERRGGWTEAPGSPERDPADIWDERRADEVVMHRSRPGATDTVLAVRGRHAAFRTFSPASGPPLYELRRGDDPIPLDGVHWADWAADGRLLAATDDGRLQVRVDPYDRSSIAWEADTADEQPDPEPPSPDPAAKGPRAR